ncbi:MAG: MFS transporter [Promethearchaeota archaeon]|jgi:DHA1 family tetracycline resistance protein-like MFS transporter
MLKIKSNYQNLTPLWIAVFVDILGFSIILPFLPFFIVEFNSSPVIIGFLLSSNAIFGFFFGPILGKLSDNYGRKPVMLVSLAGTFVGFVILVVSNNIILLFIARIVDGIFSGQFSIAKAIIGDIVPPKERPKQMTNIGITFGLAFLIGPAIGGFLSPFGIVWPAILASILTGFSTVYTAIYLKESLPKKVNPNLPANLSLTPNLVTKSTPLWKRNKTITLVIQYSFIAITGGIIQTTFSVFAGIRLGLSSLAVGILLSLLGVYQIILRLLVFNRLRKSIGDPITALLGLGTYILTYLFFGITTQVWELVILLFFLSFAGSISQGIITGFISRSVDSQNQGKIMGITTAIDNLAQIIGPIVGGILLSFTGNFPYAMALSLLSVVPFVIGFRVLKFGYDNREKTKTDTMPEEVIESGIIS